MPNVAEVSASGPAPTQPRLLEQRREGESGGRPAHQRHRARHDAEQRVLAEAARDGDAEEVLHEAEDAWRTAGRSATWRPPARSSARLALMPMVVKKATLSSGWRAVSSCTLRTTVAAHQDQQGEEQPADHGRGNVEPVEPARSAS